MQSVPQLIPAGLLVTVPLPAPAGLTVNVKTRLNVAVTVLAAFIATVQVFPDTVSHPLHPAKIDPAGAAVSVTGAPLTYVPWQEAPEQVSPVPLTVPLPVPAKLTVNAKSLLNVAVTVCAALIVTTQAPVPLHPPPLQPAKTEPTAGAAVSVTGAPLTYVPWQEVPEQDSPVPLTVPLPVPAKLTVNVKSLLNVAVTVCAALIVTTQAPVPLHPPPLQPAKTASPAAAAVTVTPVPLM